MSKVDWSKAPEWATCVVKRPGLKEDHHWSEKPINDAQLQHIKAGVMYTMGNPNYWEIVEQRPVQLINDVKPVQTKLMMTPKAGNNTYEQFIASGWDDDQLVENGYATWVNDNSESDVITTVYKPMSLADLHLAHLFTPAQQPSTAPDLLAQAEQLLTERGQQYDKSGNEWSAAKIVAAFNIITGRDLTPGEGWLFQILLKSVRFYSNTETPHRDSLEDMIAYAALHAEEYLNDK